MMHFWRRSVTQSERKVFWIYQNDHSEYRAFLPSASPLVFSLRGDYPGEIPSGTAVGSRCTWSIEQPNTPSVGHLEMAGDECAIDSEVVTASIHDFVAANGHSGVAIDEQQPFRLVLHARDSDQAPVSNPPDIHGDISIPSVEIVLRTPSRMQTAKISPLNEAPHETGSAGSHAADVDSAGTVPEPTDPDSPSNRFAEEEFYSRLNSSATLKSLGKIRLVQTNPPSTELLGPGVARCSLHANVIGEDGYSIVKQTFEGRSSSAQSISNSQLFQSACKKAINKLIEHLGG